MSHYDVFLWCVLQAVREAEIEEKKLEIAALQRQTLVVGDPNYDPFPEDVPGPPPVVAGRVVAGGPAFNALSISFDANSAFRMATPILHLYTSRRKDTKSINKWLRFFCVEFFTSNF